MTATSERFSPGYCGRSSSAYPLLEVVERAGVRLKRSGSHRWQGLCPFHEDRNPSFFVDVERQRFVCFGCKSRGDVHRFRSACTNTWVTVGEACALADRNTACRPDSAVQSTLSVERPAAAALGPTDAGAAARVEHRRCAVSGRAVAEPVRSRLPGGARTSRTGWCARVASVTQTAVHWKRICASTAGCGSPRSSGCCGGRSQGEGGRMLRERFAGPDRHPGAARRPTHLVPGPASDRSTTCA